ncbi:hypothetical protein ACRYCC_33195 [Actinomadura scrupuli]|uniref:hypothetical protein n=1 Tax=Actinomadura scrupuli TaxID=559629 RepID=UPI003D96F001
MKITPTLRVAVAAIALTTVVSACTGTTEQGTGPGSDGAVPAGGTGRMVVLSNPGHVTYTTHPAGCHVRGNSPTTLLPDPSCTPGGIDPKVTQANLSSTICKSGYTATVRPPSSDTGKAKRLLYSAYGIPADEKSELDHQVSLELGGDNDIANLWPEVGKIPNPKDAVENRLHRAVCAGTVTLAAAQRAIATDWIHAERDLGLS